MHALISLLFPPRCLACAAVGRVGGQVFCDTCALTVEHVPPGCTRCAEPGPLRAGLCPRCTRRAPPFSSASAVFVHGGALSRAIHAFKYEDRPDLAAPLGRLLVSGSGPFLGRAPVHVCGIPLHPTRFRERRYDQAQLLAGTVAHETGRTFLPQALRRTRDTARQVGQNEADRESNVRGAFQANPAQVQTRAWLLVDDVLTTGATARAATQALLDAGAREVHILTLARAHTAAARASP